MVGLLTTGKKKSTGKKLEKYRGNVQTVNHWEDEKSRKGVGKSRKEMVGLLTTGKKKSTGKKLEK
jgi:hypothetical protein